MASHANATRPGKAISSAIHSGASRLLAIIEDERAKAATAATLDIDKKFAEFKAASAIAYAQLTTQLLETQKKSSSLEQRWSEVEQICENVQRGGQAEQGGETALETALVLVKEAGEARRVNAEVEKVKGELGKAGILWVDGGIVKLDDAWAAPLSETGGGISRETPTLSTLKSIFLQNCYEFQALEEKYANLEMERNRLRGELEGFMGQANQLEQRNEHIGGEMMKRQAGLDALKQEMRREALRDEKTSTSPVKGSMHRSAEASPSKRKTQDVYLIIDSDDEIDDLNNNINAAKRSDSSHKHSTKRPRAALPPQSPNSSPLGRRNNGKQWAKSEKSPRITTIIEIDSSSDEEPLSKLVPRRVIKNELEEN